MYSIPIQTILAKQMRELPVQTQRGHKAGAQPAAASRALNREDFAPRYN